MGAAAPMLAAVARLCSRYFLDLGGGPEDCILLAGSGRSGTTWVGDVLNYENEYRTLFEPFWKRKVPLVAHFRARQYLAPGCTDPAYLEPARRILSGRIRNAFVDSLNTKWIARKRLVKDIRVNLMLGWFHARFPATPIVLLLLIMLPLVLLIVPMQLRLSLTVLLNLLPAVVFIHQLHGSLLLLANMLRMMLYLLM